MLAGIDSDILEMILFLVAAVFSVPLAKRLGLGSVLGYLIAGAIIGPVLTHYIQPVGENIFNVAEFGIIMMLFLVGLELEPKHLWAMRNQLIGMGGLQVGLTALVLAVAMLPFGMSFPAALAAGLILSLSSMAIVIPSLNERKLDRSEGGRSSLAIMLAHDVASVPILAVIPALALWAGVHEVGGAHGGEGGQVPEEWRPAWLHGLLVIGAVGALVFGGRYVVRPFLHYVSSSKLHEIFTAAALLIVIGIIALMDYVGLDPAIGAFIGGVVLADSEYKHQISADIEPFKGLLLGIFFVAVGASIDYETLLAMPLVAIAAWLGLMLIKFAVLVVVGLVFRLRMAATLLLAFALCQGDEFAFVLLPFAKDVGLFTDVQAGILNISVVLSMAATPLMFMIYERVVQPRFRESMAPKRDADEIETDDHSENLLIGVGNFGGVVGRLLEATHHKTTSLDIDSSRVAGIRKMGLEAYYGDGRELEVLEAAGIAKAKRVLVAINDEEGTNHIVEQVQKHYPAAKLFVRARTRVHAYQLVRMGVERVYVETSGSAQNLTMDVLRDLGMRESELSQFGPAMRRIEEKSIRVMSKEPLDEQSYFLRGRDSLELLRHEVAEIRDASDPAPGN